MDELAAMASTDSMRSSFRLPNCRSVPNRLVKVAMVEGIGMGGGLPDYRHRRLYKRWGEGGWGMIITGNCQVDPLYLATGQDRTFPDHSDHTVHAYAALRNSTLSNLPDGAEPPVLLVQLSHGGLQSSSTVNGSRWPWQPAVAPCSARPDTASSSNGVIGVLGWIWGRAMWPSPSRQIIDFDEWEDIVQRFINSARTVEKAGYDGVQIHSAHGYLLAEYLSPLTNPDVRPLPGVPATIPLRLHMLWKILRGVKEVTSADFILAVKINSSDFVQGGLDEAQSTVLIEEIVSWGSVDILEISGGNYSSPAFTTYHSQRETLFGRFAKDLIPRLPRPPQGPAILLTGGLHSRRSITHALESRACDLAGIGRPACLNPTFARDVILNAELTDDQAATGVYRIPGGDTMKWILGGGGSDSVAHRWETTAVPDPESAASHIPPASYAETEGSESTPLLRTQAVPESIAATGKKSGGIPLVGAGVSTFWHGWQLSRMGRGLDPDMRMNWLFGGVIWEMVIMGIVGAMIGLFTT